MEDKFVIIINKDGNKVICSPVIQGELYGYELREDEQIIEVDYAIANAMNKPRWNFDNLEWEETEPKETNKIDTCSKPTIEEQVLATQKMLLSLQEQIIDMA